MKKKVMKPTEEVEEREGTEEPIITGEKYHEINFAKIPQVKLNTLKKICSKYEHQFDVLPCTIYELSLIEKKIPEEFLKAKIILSEATNEQPLILANPTYEKKGFKRYVKYSDPFDKSTWVKKRLIPLTSITERDQFEEKIAELDETITISEERRQELLNAAKRIFGVIKKGAPVVKKVAVGGVKMAGKATKATGQGVWGFLNNIGRE